MSRSDGKSAAPPLRNRKSKRFDHSRSNQRPGEPTDDEAVSSPTVDTIVDVDEKTPEYGETIPAEIEEEPHEDSDLATTETQPDEPDTTPSGPSVVTEGTVRSKTLDERQTCGRCGHELSMVNIEVDGNVLIMESCDNCDARRWHLAGEPIELEQVLDHVGEHAGRRR